MRKRAAVSGGPIDWTGWVHDPITSISLLVLGAIYLDGLVRAHDLSRRIGISRQATAFFTGLGLAALTLLSPLDGLGYQFFAAHMLQHLLLIVVVAPLLAWSDAATILPLAVSDTGRQHIRHWLLWPAIRRWQIGPRSAWLAATAFIVTIWLWHIPAAHDAALINWGLHALEHLTVLGTATLFWRVILTDRERGVGQGLAAVIVSLVSLQGSLLSAILMFAPRQLCGSYAGNPMEDQVMAGLLMCIPASFVYLGSTVWALSRLIGGGSSHAC